MPWPMTRNPAEPGKFCKRVQRVTPNQFKEAIFFLTKGTEPPSTTCCTSDPDFCILRRHEQLLRLPYGYGPKALSGVREHPPADWALRIARPTLAESRSKRLAGSAAPPSRFFSAPSPLLPCEHCYSPTRHHRDSYSFSAGRRWPALILSPAVGAGRIMTGWCGTGPSSATWSRSWPWHRASSCRSSPSRPRAAAPTRRPAAPRARGPLAGPRRRGAPARTRSSACSPWAPRSVRARPGSSSGPWPAPACRRPWATLGVAAGAAGRRRRG